MAGGLDVVVSFLADMKGLQKGVDDTQKKLGGLRGTIAKVGGAVAGAFAAAKVFDFAKESVTAASDLNESMSKVGVVFGTSAQQVQDFAKTSATSMGLSQQAALEAVGTYGNLAVSLGLPQKTAAKMSTSLVKLAGDLASFNNVSPDEALQALRSGLTGETEPLKRFGVSLSATAIQAEALDKGLAKAPVNLAKVHDANVNLHLAQQRLAASIKKYGQNSTQATRATLAVHSAQNNLTKAMEGGQVHLTAAQNAMATYSIIMQETKTAQGDFGRTSGGLANQQRIMAAQMENVKATVGQALLPVIVQLAKVFTTDLVPILKIAAGFFKENAGWLVPLAAVIATIVAVTKIWSIVQAALNVVLAANPIVLIVLAIAGLVAGIVYLATKTQFFQTVWAAMCAAVSAAWRAVSGAVVGAVKWIWNVIMAAWNWIKKNWPLLVGILAGPIGIAVVMIVRHWDTILGGLQTVWNWIKGAWGSVVGFLTAPIGFAVGLIKDAWNGMVGWFSGLPGRIGAIFVQVASAIGAPFRYIFNAIAWAWNHTVGALSFKVPGWVPGLGGKGFDVPDMPTLARGGLVTQTGPVFAHAGEVIAPIDKVPRGPAVHIENAHFTTDLDVEAFMRRVAWTVQTQRI